MGVRDKTLEALALCNREHGTRVAAFPPSFPPKNNGAPPPFPGGPTKRNIPVEHPFDPKALKPMSKALWAASVALGHALTSYKHLSRLKSTSVSPDGNLGGRGYVMSMKDARQKLYEACEALSAISDTLHDEITAPHWKPKLAQLDENDQEDVTRFVEESKGIMADPEGDAEDDISEIEQANDGKKKKDEASQVPEGGAQEESEAKPVAPKLQEKQASIVFNSLAARVAVQFSEANSSVSPDELGGPRVDHIGPAEGDGPWGSYNEDEYKPQNDPWSADEGGSGRRDDQGEDYDYPSPWENETARNAASATLEQAKRLQKLILRVKPEDWQDIGPSFDLPPRMATLKILRGLSREVADDLESHLKEIGGNLGRHAGWSAIEAKEHSSPAALKQYFKDNPGADKSKHTVKKDDKGKGDKGESAWGSRPDRGPSGAQEVEKAKDDKAKALAERKEEEKAERAKKPKPEQGFGKRPEPAPKEKPKEKKKPWYKRLLKKGEYDYRGESAMPDSTTEDTPTDAWDFGLGYGARGDGVQHQNPSGEGDGTKGVWGPQSGLPGSPAQSVGDTSVTIERSVQDRQSQGDEPWMPQVVSPPRGQLPQDVAGPSARTDYYVGEKDNLIQAEGDAWSTSELPGGVQAPVDVSIADAPGTQQRHEDMSTPYVRYDHTTKNERPEHQHGPPEELPWAHDTEV